MSYNGIGLKTAKGSATSGHVQRSLANNDDNKNKNYHSRQREKGRSEGVKKLRGKKTGKDVSMKDGRRLGPQRNIIEHLSKREIEVQVSELRDDLEDSNEDEELIRRKCDELRQNLMKSREVEERLGNTYKSRAKRTQEDNQDKP